MARNVEELYRGPKVRWFLINLKMAAIEVERIVISYRSYVIHSSM